MRSTLAIPIATFIAAAAAAPDPLITPRAVVVPRQDDPALLGWVDAVNGQYSDQRSCDYPATLSTSGSLAQCCASSTCTFWQSCSAGTLFASSSTSLFCDQGYCNTAVLVNTVGASTGPSYLGCWATRLGQSEFTIIRDIGGVAATGSVSSSAAMASDSAASSSASESASRSMSGTAGSATRSSAGTAASTTAAGAAGVAPKPLTGVFGLVAIAFGML